MTDNWFLITGINPEPWEASEVTIGRKNGKLFPHFHKPDQLRFYQEAVASEFQVQNPDFNMLDGDIALHFRFWRQLEQSELDNRRRRAHIADATNLQKALEDALQGILYKNDRNNRLVSSMIVAQGPEIEPFILILAEPFMKGNIFTMTQVRDDILESRPEPTVSSDWKPPDIESIF